jgi:hypothetical protein
MERYAIIIIMQLLQMNVWIEEWVVMKLTNTNILVYIEGLWRCV